MKKFFILFAAVLTVQVVSAQDILITKEGDTMKVWGAEVSSTAVFYRESEALDDPIKRIDKTNVLMIKYQDGRKEIIGEADGHIKQQSTIIQSAKAQDVQDESANTALIQAFNQAQQINYIGEKKSKDAKFIYGLFNVKSDSKLIDKNIEISLASLRTNEAEASHAYLSYSHTRNGTPSYCAIAVTVKNRTGQTLYLDLGNTFFLRNGSPFPYYVPSATQTTASTTTGASVNMGAVAGALGVGGRVGALANGVNVGGANTNSTSVITYSQRVIPIPAHSSKTLDLQLLFPEILSKIYGAKYIHLTKHRLHCLFEKGERISLGEERVFDESNSPIQWGIHITYADDESISTPNSLSASFYTSKMIGCKYSQMHTFDGAISKDQLPETFRDLVSFVAWQGR